MFPDDDLEYIVDGELADEGLNIFDGKAFLFDFETGDFVYKNGAPILLEGKEALKAWIEKCIRTVKYRAIVHSDLEYGPQIDDLIGSVLPTDFVKAEIEREITEALLRNPFITSVVDFSFEVEGSRLIANLTVNSTYDDEVLEVNT